MIVENFEYPSKLGRPVQYTWRSHEESSDILTVIFPGQMYYKDAPLMWYSALASFEAGSDVLSLEYSFQSNRVDVEPDTLDLIVSELRASLESFLDSHKYEKLIFISKSIGTLFVTKLCTGDFRTVDGHIFQTPLRPTIEFMNNSSDIMVIVGDNDPAFTEEDLDLIEGKNNIHLVLFEGADHLLEVKGDFSKSLDYLQRISAETFNYIGKLKKS